MEESEKMSMLKILTGETDETLLSVYLELAANSVLRKRFPYDPSQTLVPTQYSVTQVKIASYLFSRRGAEGEESRSENGISVKYENGDVPLSLLSEIIPLSKSIYEVTE
jgi:hypothetical protein